MILIQSEFHLTAAVTKRYQYTQEDVRKIMENGLRDTPSSVRRSERKRQTVEEESDVSHPGEIEL